MRMPNADQGALSDTLTTLATVWISIASWKAIRQSSSGVLSVLMSFFPVTPNLSIQVQRNKAKTGKMSNTPRFITDVHIIAKVGNGLNVHNE